MKQLFFGLMISVLLVHPMERGLILSCQTLENPELHHEFTVFEDMSREKPIYTQVMIGNKSFKKRLLLKQTTTALYFRYRCMKSLEPSKDDLAEIKVRCNPPLRQISMHIGRLPIADPALLELSLHVRLDEFDQIEPLWVSRLKPSSSV
jgi:hypothetical protein